MKTKPTQGCVRELQSIGLRPDVLVCRSDYPLTQDIRDKLALFCNVRPDHVLQNLDASILYQVPLMMEDEHLAEVVLSDLGLPQREPDLTQWRQMCDRWMHPKRRVDIALVGKYTKLHDAYLSVAEALRHAGVANDAHVEIHWIDSETVTPENVGEILGDMSGIIVPGGFGSRGIDGMIESIRYAREHRIPFLGLCLGMQLAIVEFARHVVGLPEAHSIELMPDTPDPVIHLMADQKGVLDIGGDPVGARVLARFRPKILQEDHQLVYVLNANRPEVRAPENAIAYLRAIEATTGLTCGGIVNNTHLCGETTEHEIRKGADLAERVSEETGIPVLCHVAEERFADHLRDLREPVFPITIKMKKPWEL